TQPAASSADRSWSMNLGSNGHEMRHGAPFSRRKGTRPGAPQNNLVNPQARRTAWAGHSPQFLWMVRPRLDHRWRLDAPLSEGDTNDLPALAEESLPRRLF